MSEYANFVSDFPKRCDGLLTKLFPPAKVQGNEVTLMLSIATAGFVIPFERLRQPEPSSPPHPAKDRERFDQAARDLDEILESYFLGSPLWETSPGSWIYASRITDEQQDLSFWPELRSPKSVTNEKTTRRMLKDLRNALAHGNIFTHGSPINRLIFLSREHQNSSKFSMLAVSPSDFRKFLHNWFEFLSSLKVPATVYQGSMVA